MRWIKAGNYNRLSAKSKKTALAIGYYPINNVLMPFMEDDSPVILLYGGRGGGKSNTIALRLIKEAINQTYFKCYYGRKVLDRVRGSQHSELIKSIRQLGVEGEFEYSVQPNGSLTIVNKATGNSFHAFGGDNPESMKSISDPTHIWTDEFDQFSDYDFRALFPTLRTTRGKNIFIGSFNSYEVLKDHWLVRFFFPHMYEGKGRQDFNALDGLKVSKYLVNYSDNYFIDHLSYEKSLRLAAGGDAELYEGLARGDFGTNKKGDEYYHSFKRSVHVGDVQRIPSLPDHLSIDFNLVPYMTMICSQIQEMPTEIQIRIYKEYCLPHPRNTTEALCRAYLDDYEPAIADIFYYGDAMGNRGIEGYGDDITRFDPVRSILFRYLTSYSDRTKNYNEGVSKRRDLMNRLFEGLLILGDKKVSIIIDSKCYETIKDFMNLKQGVNGKHKEKVKDDQGRAYEKYGHPSDCIEYSVSYILEPLIQ